MKYVFYIILTIILGTSLWFNYQKYYEENPYKAQLEEEKRLLSEEIDSLNTVLKYNIDQGEKEKETIKEYQDSLDHYKAVLISLNKNFIVIEKNYLKIKLNEKDNAILNKLLPEDKDSLTNFYNSYILREFY